MHGWLDGWDNMWVNGDNMRTMKRQHGVNMGTYRDVETTWGQHGDHMGTT